MKYARMLAATLALVASTAHAAYTLVPYDSRGTGGPAEAVAIGDVDGDGRTDVVVTTGYADDEQFRSLVLVHLQQPDGAFAVALKFPYPPSNSSELAIGNLDSDRAQEIVVGHGSGITILDWDIARGVPSVSSHTHGNTWYRESQNVAFVDINRDGALDVVGKGFGADVLVYVGDGQGGVRNIVRIPLGLSGYNDLTVGDFNGDGFEDYAVMSSVLRTYVVLNNGLAAANPTVRVIQPTGSSAYPALTGGDFNDDGLDDLAMATDFLEAGFFTQNTAHQLASSGVLSLGSSPTGLLGHDFDLDGRDDLLVNMSQAPLTLFLQNAGGVSEHLQISYMPDHQRDVFDAGDIDGDDCTDLAIVRQSEFVVYRGEGCQPVADLAVNLGLTATTVAVRLDNFGAAAAAAPETTLTLSVSMGTLALGTLPAECTIAAQDAASARITCLGADLAADSSRTLLLPVVVGSNDIRSALTAAASTHTTTVDLHPENNTARRLARVPGLTIGNRHSAVPYSRQFPGRQ